MIRASAPRSFLGKLAFIGAGALVLMASGCPGRVEPEEQAARNELCEEMKSSLREDIRVAGDLFLVSGAVEIDRANDVTEERLVAMQAMVGHCRLWARGEQSADEFAENVRRHAGVYTSAEDQAQVDARLAGLEAGVGQLPDDITRAITERLRAERPAIVSEAVALGADANRMETQNNANFNAATSDMPGAVRSIARTEYRQMLEEAQIESRLISMQSRLDTVEGRIGSLYYYQVFFDTLSFELTPDMQRYLDELASDRLQQAQRIRVVGFADEEGRDAGNLALSQTRAMTVRQYLEARGLAVEDSAGVGRSGVFGGDQSANRRVVIEVVD